MHTQGMGLQPGRRTGRAGGALTVGLFLLSCVALYPLIRWGMGDNPAHNPMADYAFADDDPAGSTPQPAAPPNASAVPAPNVETTTEAESESKQAAEIQPQIEIIAWQTIADLPGKELAQFQSVFWEPRDTDSLRDWIRKSDAVPDRAVMEIGTGTGLLSLCCAHRGAAKVVATDINPMAVLCARYNAENLGFSMRMSVRQVPKSTPGPFVVIGADEKFDLIISNPPWEDSKVLDDASYALYDPGFGLLDGILAESAAHLKPGGKLLLAYGTPLAIQRIIDEGPKHGWQVDVKDDRKIQELPEVFLPGMLLELVRNE